MFHRIVNEIDSCWTVDINGHTYIALEVASDRDSLAQNWDHVLIRLTVSGGLHVETEKVDTYHLIQVQAARGKRVAAKKTHYFNGWR